MNTFAYAAVFPHVDAIVANVNQHKYEPLFSQEVSRRQNNKAAPFETENEIFACLCEVIALSNGSQSRLVDVIIKNGQLAEAFANFDLMSVAEMNPCVIVEKHWKTIGAALRRKTKAFQITMAARAIIRADGLKFVFNRANLPRTISTLEDIEQFWAGFNLLKAEMVRLDIPYLKATTSLLHFLLHNGYDCAKPDSAVMKVSKRLGLASGKTPKQKENDRIAMVRMMQEFGLCRRMRPCVLDFYILIAGGQTWASQHVTAAYYDPNALNETTPRIPLPGSRSADDEDDGDGDGDGDGED